MIKKVVLLLAIIYCTAVLTGCNTLHGMGKDIESLGQALSNTADKK
ncbi:MAG: entericidin, EcnA/B family [Nitrospiraceae bacterium]|nr:MAG: entericidin, EcnA/B family [Nitrospiraceae bacterium]